MKLKIFRLLLVGTLAVAPAVVMAQGNTPIPGDHTPVVHDRTPSTHDHGASSSRR